MECLIVNFDNLGDVVFSSWISDYLSKNYDNISIDVLCSSYTKDIAECYPGVRKVFHLAPIHSKSREFRPDLLAGSMPHLVLRTACLPGLQCEI